MSRRISRDSGGPPNLFTSSSDNTYTDRTYITPPLIHLCADMSTSIESCLGKRSRCENRVSQDYSHCDDLAGLESVNPAVEYFERISETMRPTEFQVHSGASIPFPNQPGEASYIPTPASSLDSTYSTQSAATVSSATNLTGNSSMTKKASTSAWGWFVSGGDEDIFS